MLKQIVCWVKVQEANMKKPPSQEEMMQPTNAQGGEPNYIDESADSVKPFHSVEDYPDAPAYIANNPRYWEYR